MDLASGTLGCLAPLLAPSRYRDPMLEAFGDSTRDGEWASVRLLVDGDRIVEADAPGVERPLAGLTLLEAAAVGGETLAVDALANALGPIFRCEPRAGRTAVAMSGGVDSAVALLRAAPNAIGVTLRLWLDPDGPDCRTRLLLAGSRDRCARDLSPPRAAARDARPARGVSPRGRRRRSCAATRAARRRTRASAATAASASASCSPSRSAPAATGSQPGTTRASRSIAAGSSCTAPPTSGRTSRTCSRALDPARLDRIWFPLGEQDKETTRSEAERAGLEVARRAESQEACFLAGDDYRAFLGTARPRAARRRRRRRARHGARAARRLLAVHARGSARASASPRRRRSTCSTPTRRRTRSSSARSSRSRAAASPRRAASTSTSTAQTRSSGTGRRRSAASVSARPGGFELEPRRARLRRGARPGGRALRRRRRRRAAGTISSVDAD